MAAVKKLPILFLALPLFAGCGRPQGAAASGGGPGGGPGAQAIPVKAAPVQAQDVTYRIHALGSLEAEEMVQVTAEVEGALSEIRFHEGDRVTPQTVLALIDPERYRLEAERAEANYRKALADENRAKADLKRREDLARDQLVAVEELNRNRQETERLVAESASAKAARDIALQNQQRSQIRARRAGVINARQADPGQFVRAGTVLATIVDTSRLRLRFKISEAESLQAKEGQTVSFKVSAARDREFTGTLYHVGEVADPATRQVEVLAWVKNPGDLKPGFFAEADLPTGTRQGVLVVPETAIQASERGFVAFVVEEGKARVREVQIGLRTGGGGVEILSGLKPGEQVIVQGSDRLADGVPVRTAEAPAGGKGTPGAPPAATAGKDAR
jgi:membrane fusion protein, multidrug efflux system